MTDTRATQPQVLVQGFTGRTIAGATWTARQGAW